MILNKGIFTTKLPCFIHFAFDFQVMNKQTSEYYDENGQLYLHHSSKQLRKKWKKRESDVKRFLSSQRYYTLYKQSTAKQNTRSPYRVPTIDHTWEIDLAMIPSLSKFNSGISILLVCIDVFSRFAFVRPLQSKHPREVIKCLTNIFTTTKRKPWAIQCDSGLEFSSRETRDFFKHNNIDFRTVRSTLPAKCAVVERFVFVIDINTY